MSDFHKIRFEQMSNFILHCSITRSDSSRCLKLIRRGLTEILKFTTSKKEKER